jgi:hypothetical protein
MMSSTRRCPMNTIVPSDIDTRALERLNAGFIAAGATSTSTRYWRDAGRSSRRT